MKKKVNVNREKISSDEISSRKNFMPLIKNYGSLANPSRKTSWRTKSILWVIIGSALLVIYIAMQNKFEGYEANRILVDGKPYLNLRTDPKLQERIQEQVITAKKTDASVVGGGIELEMVNDQDTIRIKSYGGGRYFFYDKSYFQSNENLLPDSIIRKILN
jgi:hypothetical protein